ncbi:MAG: hypothetical protein OHK0013_19140 [Sandaracinaceae bacterium]
MTSGWREKVEKDLGGAGFERTLVTKLPGSLRIQPLYDVADREGRTIRVGRAGAVSLAVVRWAGPGVDAPVVAGGGRWILGETSATDGLVEANGALRDRGEPLAHALDVHEGGGSVPLEVAVAIGRFLDGVRSTGRAPALGVAVGTEIFVEIAKLRALRALASRAAEALLGGPVAVRIAARTSLVSFSRIEPQTNALRATLGCVAAIVGGADLVATAPYDLLAPSTDPEVRARAERLAATTGLVATLESHLASTIDPAHGAYFVEALTADVCARAWDIVRELERAGGAAAAPGVWRERLAADAELRRRDAACGKLPRVGASRLAAPGAPAEGALHPLAAHVFRDTAAFEMLREVARPVSLVIAGDARKLGPREDYVRDVVAAWGARTDPLRYASVAEATEVVLRSALHDVVVVCVEDADFAVLSPLVRRLAQSAGSARAVVIAGRPGASEGALREAGARAFLHLGADLVAVAREIFGGAG